MFINDYKNEIKEYFIKNYSRIKFNEDDEIFEVLFFDKNTSRDYKIMFEYGFMQEPKLLLKYKNYNLMQSSYIDNSSLEFKEMEYVEYVIRTSIDYMDRYCRQYEEREDYFNII